MFNLLYQYFIQAGQLSLPGIGHFKWTQQTAVLDFPNQQLLPPVYAVSFSDEKDSPSRDLFRFIARKKQLTEWEAIKAINDFAFGVKDELRSGKSVSWPGIGNLQFNQTGGISFEAAAIPSSYTPAPAVRVIRNDAEHSILVGDREKTNTEMAEMLHEEPATAPSRWWIWALVLAAIGISGLVYHFMQHPRGSFFGYQQLVN
jgi:hypothetical protein